MDYPDAGVEVIEGQNGYYIFDTKVRILLKMGKTEDAYEIAQRVLSKDPSFGDFQDIKASKEYKAWLKKHKQL